MWIYLGLLSAFFIGLYDISKKHAVHENAVLPVLFFSTLTGAMVMVLEIVASRMSPLVTLRYGVHVPVLSFLAHGVIFIKAMIVSAAWCFTYCGLKRLPISIVAPISASGPIWTLFGAVLLFREKPTSLQWTEIGISFLSYYLF